MLRIEDKLTVLIGKVLDKYTASLMSKIESMVNEKVDKLSSDQNSVTTGLAKETLKLVTLRSTKILKLSYAKEISWGSTASAEGNHPQPLRRMNPLIWR